MIWLILSLGFILRLISLNQSFWLDEATSATVVKTLSFGEIITKFSPGDFHPPFYYLLLKVWTLPFGVNEIWARALSILVSLVTVYIAYLIGRLIKSKAFGETAAILTATAPLLVYYSQEARMYSLEVLLVSLAVYLFIKIEKETENKKNLIRWIGFGITLLILGLTDYLPLLIIPVFWIYSALKKRKLNWFTNLTLSHIPLAIGYVWWAPYFVKQLSAGLSVKDSSPGWWAVLGQAGIKEAALLPVKFMIGRIGFDNKIIYGLIVVVVGALFGYLIFKSIKALKKNVLIALWLIVPIVLAFILSFKLSVFSYFRLIFVLPAFYLLISLGLYEMKKKYFPLVFLTLVLINSAFSLTYLLNVKYHREDWRGVVNQIGDSPVVFPAHSQREAFNYYDPNPNIIEIDSLDKKQKELYLMRYVADIFDPEDKVRQKVEELGYKKVNDYNFNGVVMWRYER